MGDEGYWISFSYAPNGYTYGFTAVNFSAPNYGRFSPGVYQADPNHTADGNAGLDFLGYGTITSTSYQFTVNQAVYDPVSGALERFDAVFPTGRVSWNASVPGAVGLLGGHVDADGDPLTVRIVAGPQHGTLVLDSAGGFIYTPNQYFSGVDSFQYVANDGLADGNAATVTIDVQHVSQAPVGTSGMAGITAATPYALRAADFGFTDPNDSPPDVFVAVEITTLPTAGGLALSGVAVAPGQLISAADLAAGNLMFTPPASPGGGTDPSLTFQVEDSGNTANGGANLDPYPRNAFPSTRCRSLPIRRTRSTRTVRSTRRFVAADDAFQD